MNLLDETIEKLKDNGKHWNNVKWVGTREHSMSWQEFARIADFEYDAGYGSVEIDEGLLIVGDNWWLSRQEYDGSESWIFNKTPEQPPIKKIKIC